jgi:hypothetical protein
VAVKNAIKLARDYVITKVQEKIQSELVGIQHVINGVKA